MSVEGNQNYSIKRQLLEECSLEIVNEGADHVFDEVESEVSILARQGGVIERYACHSAELGLIFTVGETGKYCLFLHRPFVSVGGSTARLPEHILGTNGNDQECAVLIRVPVLLESPNGLLPVLVTAEARLKCLDSVLYSLIHAQHFAGRFPLPAVGVVKDREFSPVVRDTVSLQDELPSKMVECRAEIKEDVPNNRKGRGRDWLASHLPQLIAGIRLNLDDDGVWFQYSPIVESPFEFYQMFFGPCYLDPDTVEFIHELNYDYE